MRITNRMMSERTIADLSTQLAAMARAQERLTSGKAILRPSDDPAGTRTALRLRDTLDATAQHLRNIEAASRDMAVADTARAGASEVIQRARELALQGATGSLGADDRAMLAREVEQLARTLVGHAGTTSGDRRVFSGFRTGTAPYAEAPAGSAAVSAYAGDTGAIMARIAPDVTVQVNVTADEAFGPALAALAALHADLTGGGAVQGSTLTALDDGLEAVLGAWATLGARANRLESTRETLEGIELTTTTLLSTIEDADLADAVVELTTRQRAYEAAIKANGQLFQASLFDVLR
jgi:flagellar hook-associated protein 3 FlgL